MESGELPTKAIDHVVFDLGGVLVDWDPRYLFCTIFQDHEEMEQFLGNVCTRAWNEEQDAGRLWSVAVAELTCQFPQYRAYIQIYHERWQEMLRGEISGTVEILRELKEHGVPLFALTNWSAETFPIARHCYEFLAWFQGIIVSGEELLIKPDPRIFQLLQTRYGLVPQRTLFIDDVEKNIVAAQGLGFNVIKFEKPEQLRQEMAKFTLLSSAQR